MDVLVVMHGRGRMTIDPRIPTMPGQTRGEGRRSYLLVALVISPSTTHPFRDGAPLLRLLIIDTSNSWALITMFPFIKQKFFANLTYPLPVVSPLVTILPSIS